MYGRVRIASIIRHLQLVMLSKSAKIMNAMVHAEILITEIELGSFLGM